MNLRLSPLLAAVWLSLSGLSGARADALSPVDSSAAEAASIPAAPDESLRVDWFAKAYRHPSEDAPLLGVIADGSRLPVFRRAGAWAQVGFGHAIGWIRDRGVEAGGSAPADLPVISGDARGGRLLPLALISALLLLAAMGVTVTALLRKRIRYRGDGTVADLSRWVVIVAARDKVIPSGVPGIFVSLEKCFRDIGFAVTVVPAFRDFARLARIGVPALVAVDCRLRRGPLRAMDKLGRLRTDLAASLVLFYNVMLDERIVPPASLAQAHYLGQAFGSQQVMEIVAPALQGDSQRRSDAAPRPEAAPGREAAERAGQAREACALEGKITPHGLAEILQFLEIGRRTGLLSAENGMPAGVINFEAGVITFAQTRYHEGLEAAMEMLSLCEGGFHFFADKKLRGSNCRLVPTDVLMQWARRMDESAVGVPQAEA